MGKGGKRCTTLRPGWQTVNAASESLRFVETAGFVSLEECEQELFDPANPPPIFMSDVAGDGDDADGDDGGSTQLQQAQAEVDRLMRMHALRPPDEAVVSEDAEATRIPPPSKASRDKAAKRKRAEPERDAEAGPSPQGVVAEADGAVDGSGDGDGVAAPARKKRTRQKKKKKKKTVKKPGADASVMAAAGGGAPAGSQAAGVALAAPNAPDAAARERGGASGRELSESERAAAALNWERLGLHSSLVHGLVTQGFGAPTPIQEAALPPALHGMRDLVGAAQTGSGKTLAFGLPILHRLIEEAEAAETDSAADIEAAGAAGAAAAAHPVASRGLRGGSLFALIMTPTRELAAQVTAHLQAVAASCPLLGRDCIISLVGGLSLDKQRRQLASRPRVVVATPGRLWELIREGSTHLQSLPGVRFFVLDEVDRMIEAGHFQELSRILEMLDQPQPPNPHLASHPAPADGSQQDPILGPSMPPVCGPSGRRRQTFLMSATLMLPPAAREAHAKKVKNHQPVPQGSTTETLMRTLKFLNPVKVVDLSSPAVVAQRLTQAKVSCLSDEKDAVLCSLLASRPGRSIVFCNAVSTVARLRSLLALVRLPAVPLQGGMQQRARIKALERFRAAEHAILLATDVAARGLDIRNVDYVIHYQLPRSAEVYVHRSGRTARASAAGLSIALVDPSDAKSFRRLCFELQQPDGLPDYALPPKALPRAVEALRLARRVDKAEHSQQRRAKDAASVRRMAEQMDLPMSEDEMADEEDRHTNGRQQAREGAQVARDKAQLQAMLDKLGWADRWGGDQPPTGEEV